jgi:CheY-like chemotaxis protein
MRTTHQSEKPTVLVVEDHEDTARLLRLILEREGYFVTHVVDGGAAQRLIAATAPPDLMLLDIMLPTLTGLELLRVVRTTPEWQWIPVIILTADIRNVTMAEAANLGATEYVQKPFVEELLLASIHRFLPKSPVHRGEALGRA